MLRTSYMAGLFLTLLVRVSANDEERPSQDACAEVTKGASFVQMEAHKGRGQGLEEEEETGTMKSELATLRKSMAEMFTQITDLHKERKEMFTQITDLRNEVADLRKSSPFTVAGNTVKLENKDLHIRSGNIQIDAASGIMKGNIVIGNNDVTNARHSFAAGYANNVEGKAHFVVGQGNTVRGTRASVLGGTQNTADGEASVVVGGRSNSASGQESVAIGGQGKSASSLRQVA